MKNKLKLVGIVVTLFLLAACQSTPYDYTKLMESKPRSILVLPPMNNSVEVNAPYTFLSTISKPLAERGYYVFPVAVIDAFMKENGLPTPAEMHQVPLQKLHQEIGADAVLYVQIEQWGQSYQIINSKTEVKATLKLVDARTGNLLWDTTAHAVQNSDDGGGGLVGAVVGAVVAQIIGNLTDPTPGLSSTANNIAVNNTSNGLLYGPYAPPGKPVFQPLSQK